MDEDARRILELEATGFTPTKSEDAALRDVIRRSANVSEPPEGADASSVGSRYVTRRRAIAAALVAAIASVALVTIAVAQGNPTEDEVAAELGLTAHPIQEGDVLVATAEGLMKNGIRIEDFNCASTDSTITLVQEVDDHFYCITAATEIDAWIIGQRLQGHEPTSEEIAAQAARLEK